MSDEVPTITEAGDNIDTLNGIKAKNQLITAEGDYQTYFLYGDAINLINGARGGNDVIIGMSILNNQNNKVSNQICGDGYLLQKSLGGNDQIFGGNSVFENFLIGDSFSMLGSKGGNDYLKGGDNAISNLIFGDASEMNGEINSDGLMISSRGGNDILIGGVNSINQLCGDSLQLMFTTCGNDLLISGDVDDGFLNAENFLIGDAIFVYSEGVIGGNDRLISGTGRDSMWGDFFTISSVAAFGNDTFVFKSNNGADTIYDFHIGEDKIELSGIIGIDDFTDLQISEFSGSSLITVGIDNTIQVNRVTGLQAEDFIFS